MSLPYDISYFEIHVFGEEFSEDFSGKDSLKPVLSGVSERKTQSTILIKLCFWDFPKNESVFGRIPKSGSFWEADRAEKIYGGQHEKKGL